MECKAGNTEGKTGKIEGIALNTYVTVKKGSCKKVLESKCWRTQEREVVVDSGERLDTDTAG